MKMEIDLQEISEKGLEPTSPLLWALLPWDVDYILFFPGVGWCGYWKKPKSIRSWGRGDFLVLYIKINGDSIINWRRSLTERPK